MTKAPITDPSWLNLVDMTEFFERDLVVRAMRMLAPLDDASGGDLIAVGSTSCLETGESSGFAFGLVEDDDPAYISYSVLCETNEAFAMKLAHASALINETNDEMRRYRENMIQVQSTLMDILESTDHRKSRSPGWHLVPDEEIITLVGHGWGLLVVPSNGPHMNNSRDSLEFRGDMFQASVLGFGQDLAGDSAHAAMKRNHLRNRLRPVLTSPATPWCMPAELLAVDSFIFECGRR